MLQIPPQAFKDILVQENLITDELFEQLMGDAKRMGQNISDILISRNIINADYFTNLLARYYKVEIADLAHRGIDHDILTLLSEDIARSKRVILFQRESNGVINAAMEDPTNLETVTYLENILKTKIHPFFATDEDLNKGFSFFGQQTAESFKRIIEEHIAASLREGEKDAEKAASQVPIVGIIDNVMLHAISLRASDIHLEILEDALLVRYRIDGILHEILRIPKDVHPAIVARVKLLARLKIDEHNRPQDGRFRYSAASEVVDVRVSVVPTFYGEKVEMRLLEATQKPMSFKELGMLEETVRMVNDEIRKSYGMVLICGPTGSGKTSTLYAILNTLNQTNVNIVTIEDPIEYNIKYVNQIQANPQADLTFANGLRSILRQDPNIIMVGEIRDEDTAAISVNAALTGHLLLSSLHTNDAPTAVPRLIDMNVEPFLVSAVLNIIVAQRLVRKIHSDCITSYEPDKEIVALIQRQLKGLGIDPVAMSVPKTLYRGKGCEADEYTGYQGRTGIFEALRFNEEMRALVSKSDFTLEGFRKLARDGGMVTMFEDGMRKVERGVTTIEELLRVIGE